MYIQITMYRILYTFTRQPTLRRGGTHVRQCPWMLAAVTTIGVLARAATV